MSASKLTRSALAFLACAALTMMPTPSAHAQTQAEMNQAAGRDAGRADAAMNAACQKLMAVLTPAQKTQLVKAQRAWLAYRDAEAALRSSQSIGGSMHPMVYAAVTQSLTETRTRELNAFRRELNEENSGRQPRRAAARGRLPAAYSKP